MSSGAQRSGWDLVPLRAEVDLSTGGRFTSLRAGEREWLWCNPDPAVHARRRSARPGDPFVDAGGGEECLPTIGGDTDHGVLWSARWSGSPEEAATRADGWHLLRRVTHRDGGLDVAYTVAGAPGRPFLHAVHLLLDTSPTAHVQLPGAHGHPCWVDDETRERGRWTSSWPPRVGRFSADRLGPDDGSALLLLVPGVREALVIDGDHALRLSWSVPTGQPTSVLLWRNLGGWPGGAPYRTTGVEPLLGCASDLSQCSLSSERQNLDHVAGGHVGSVFGRAAVLQADGSLTWTLKLTALTRRRGEVARRRPSDRPGQGL